jgi:alpha-beta hydrolase superfamily lysophospholipase
MTKISPSARTFVNQSAPAVSTPPAASNTVSVQQTKAIDSGEFARRTVRYSEGRTQGSMPYANFWSMSDSPPDLFYRSWIPSDTPRATVVLVHGTGEHSGRYEDLARALAGQGYAVYAYDQRGHGQSPGLQGHVESFREYTGDVGAFLDFVREQQPGSKVALYGHSLGSLVTLRYVQGTQAEPDALILSSPPLAPPNISPVKLKIADLLGDAPAFFRRNLVQNGIDASLLTHDPVELEKFKNDELNHPFVTPSFGKRLEEARVDALAEGHEVNVPLLTLSSPDEQVAPQTNTPSFVRDQVSSPDKTLVEFPGAGHELHKELPAIKQRYYETVTGWLNARFPAPTQQN